MNKIIEILMGFFLVVIPILIVLLVPAFYSWGLAALGIIKGTVIIFLVLAGILLIILGISDI